MKSENQTNHWFRHFSFEGTDFISNVITSPGAIWGVVISNFEGVSTKLVYYSHSLSFYEIATSPCTN